jgi:hypothetical protein
MMNRSQRTQGHGRGMGRGKGRTPMIEEGQPETESPVITWEAAQRYGAGKRGGRRHGHGHGKGGACCQRRQQGRGMGRGRNKNA